MTTPDPAKLRVGDAEREDAMRVLGEHMAAGRLDLDEYTERTAQVTAARTRADLTALFADLPEPHPTFAAAESAARTSRADAGARSTRRSERADTLRARFPTVNLASRVAGGALVAAAVFALGLFLLTALPVLLVGGLVLWMLCGNSPRGRWDHQMHAAGRRARANYYRYRRSW